MSNYNVGDLGESKFAELCAQGNMTYNKSQMDRMGWDYLIEFKKKENENRTADNSDPQIECKVQVKSSNGDSKKVKISLSNLLNMVQYTNPAFIFYIEYDKALEPSNAYLRHIDKNLIEKVLKRLRQLSIEENKKDLHKRVMTIDFWDELKLKNITGTCLRELIEKHVGNNMDSYVSQKRNHVNSAGYDTYRYSGNFITEGEESVQKMIDASIGIDVDVPIKMIAAHEVRFGIKNRLPHFKSDNAILKISSVEPIPVTVSFQNKKEDIILKFNANAYYPSITKGLPSKYFKVRIKGDFFEIIIASPPQENKFQITSVDKAMDLRSIRNMIYLQSWLAYSNDKLHLKIENATRGTLEIDISSNIPVNKIDSIEKKQLSEIKSGIDGLIDVFYKYNLDNVIEVTYLDIYANRKKIKDINEINSISKEYITTSFFPSETVFPDEVNKKKFFSFSINITMKISNESYFFIFILDAKIKDKGLQEIRIRNKKIFQFNENELKLLHEQVNRFLCEINNDVSKEGGILFTMKKEDD